MVLYIVKNILKISLTIILLLTLVLACNRASTTTLRYGVKIQYSKGQPLNFSDVTLEFVGERELPPSSVYHLSIFLYDFKVSYGNQSQLISWSSGTGDIGPTLFEFVGNSFALELEMSDKLGILDDNELVLWRMDE